MSLSPFAALQRGNRLGILAVSSPTESTRLQQGLAELASRGIEYQVELDPCAQYGRKEYLFASASVQDRVTALHKLLKDEAVVAILAVRGAYGSIDLLPHLDRQLIARSKKPIIGFSDVTALLNLWVDCGAPAIHGCHLDAAFSRSKERVESRDSADALVQLLRTGTIPAIRGTALLEGPAAEGRLIGGNLMTLAALAGTPGALSTQGSILFIEECREKPYRIHRALQQLDQAHDLKGIAGVVVGDMIECIHESGAGPTWEEIVVDRFQKRGVVVLKVSGYGHGPRNFPLPFGAPVTLTSSQLSMGG